MNVGIKLLAAAAALGATAPQAQVKWDLPAAYASGNFHTENLAQFAADEIVRTRK